MEVRLRPPDAPGPPVRIAVVALTDPTGAVLLHLRDPAEPLRHTARAGTGLSACVYPRLRCLSSRVVNGVHAWGQTQCRPGGSARPRAATRERDADQGESAYPGR
jgi:hypothetical protein